MTRFARLLMLAGLLLASTAFATSSRGPTKEAFASFVTDELPNLVEGQEFDWRGSHYRITKVHSILKTQVQRTRRTDIDGDVPYIGWAWAVLHLDVNGERMRVKVDCNARWEAGAEGWDWSKVLIYLGDNDSYDFVTKKVR